MIFVRVSPITRIRTIAKHSVEHTMDTGPTNYDASTQDTAYCEDNSGWGIYTGVAWISIRAVYDKVLRVHNEWNDWMPDDMAKRMLKSSKPPQW